MATLTLHPGDIRNYSEWRNGYAIGSIALGWLGQAGFLIQFGDITILIDPYLSDALASKYEGKKYPHARMMPPPINPEALKGIDFYLSSHAHSDHLDPGLLPIIVRNNPACRFILPFPAAATAGERGVPANRMIFLDDGDVFKIDEDTRIHGIASAHEELQINNEGHNHFLGYVLEFGTLRIYHSGDCAPYPGLKQKLKKLSPSLALLPVNGRSEELTADGVAGNFTMNEALNLIKSIDCDFMLPHHYGMFDFNTIAPEKLIEGIRVFGLTSRVFPAEINIIYQLEV